MYQVQRLIKTKTNLSKSTCNFALLGLQLVQSNAQFFVTSHRTLSGKVGQLFLTVTEGVEFE
jgi:hypothetical protein